MVWNGLIRLFKASGKHKNLVIIEFGYLVKFEFLTRKFHVAIDLKNDIHMSK